ncbi:hypothetical protein HMF7854_04635 [Sphingomonas ginkgonis]|uniref:Uncharacterized protein n=1 Tax=Sphingomonas ginkgonis TaxID=2315330 RepID=A0A429V8D5_9SPHN|nr:hypothetical protein [Sphingomonas ginkgonis]RST30195.1 hypothetical protein HMF7854_04635 [Sphingomonas ginkgonis]
MRKQKIENAAFEVAEQVRTVEDCIDETLGQLAELQSRMIGLRATAGVAVATGHAALVEVAAALQGLVAARGGMANAHAALKDAQQLVPGLRTVAFGDGEECPPKTAVAPLRVVA